MQSHDAEYRESGEGWARTPEPVVSVPLSDTRLTEYRERYAHPHGAEAIANGHVDAAVLLVEVDRLRAELVDWEQRFERLHVAHNLALGERDQARAIAEVASVLCIPREHGAPLQLRQIYDDVDRWAICDRTGKRWHRAQDGVAAGWFYEPDREQLCDLGRFTLAEALPLARQLATAPTSKEQQR